MTLSPTRLKLGFLAIFMMPMLSHAADNFKKAGDVMAAGLPMVAAGIAIAQDDASGLLQLGKSEALTIATTLALKSATHETRPNGRDNKSFPSGHSSIAFSAAQFMQLRGGWEFGVPAYIAAAAVGASRVHAKEHYTKDVLAGAAIGIASSTWFTDSQDRRSFSVMFGPRSAQAQYSARW